MVDNGTKKPRLVEGEKVSRGRRRLVGGGRG